MMRNSSYIGNRMRIMITEDRGTRMNKSNLRTKFILKTTDDTIWRQIQKKRETCRRTVDCPCTCIRDKGKKDEREISKRQ